MKPVYVIRSDHDSACYLKSFGMTPHGGEIHFTADPFEALHFGSWEEAAAVASFIVFHVDEEYAGCFEVAQYVM